MQKITKSTVLSALQNHIGKENGVNSKQLASDIARQANTLFSERLLRKHIENLRDEGQHICGTPETGYFIAKTDTELDDACEFLYRRAMASLRKISAMKRTSLPDLRGQLRLPT